MEYSIQALARLAGVTTRTLRWYDQIGLLKPSRVADNGYRYYGPAEVDRLQDILYYRALGVALAQIRTCLDEPSFDRLAVLRSHLTALQGERARLEQLIRSVEATIGAMERKETMEDSKKFEAFKRQAVAWHEVDQAQAAVQALTQDQYLQWKQLGEEIQGRLEQAVRSGRSPQGAEGEAITALHRRWLTFTGQTYAGEKHRGLAALYTQDPRFTAYYDRAVPGCAAFLQAAVEHWA